MRKSLESNLAGQYNHLLALYQTVLELSTFLLFEILQLYEEAAIRSVVITGVMDADAKFSKWCDFTGFTRK